jgi:hypothetical protein
MECTSSRRLSSGYAAPTRTNTATTMTRYTEAVRAAAMILILITTQAASGARLHRTPSPTPPSQPQAVAPSWPDKPLVVQPLPIQRSPEQVRSEETEASRHLAAEESTATYTAALVWVTGILALFTFLLWWANLKLIKGAEYTAERQSGEMQQSITEAHQSALAMADVAATMRANTAAMQETMKKQMRAYVSADPGLGVYQDEHNNFQGAVVLTNSGFTPAKHIAHRVHATVLATEGIENHVFEDTKPYFTTDSSLSPRTTYTITAGIVPDRLPAEEVQEAMLGNVRRLFVWGSVTYVDVFDEPHETFFCHNFVFPTINNEVKVGTYYHNNHNRTT